MANVSHWLNAFRLRTLPLALSSISMAGFLAYDHGMFNGVVFGLCVSTTLFLQILSNLANDYGDSVHGADNHFRVGPPRTVQSGVITSAEMKKAMILFSILSLISGIVLLVQVKGLISLNVLGVFFIVGLLAIAAAIMYTSGHKPYGYAGLGDVSVFLFFGFVAVCGTFYLQVGKMGADILLPAFSCGLLSAGVLNVNNLRDIESDKLVGKMSIPVRIGSRMGKAYHLALISFAFLYATIYVILQYTSVFNFMYILTVPFFVYHIKGILNAPDSKALDPYLKQLALSTLLFVITFGIGISFF